MERKKLVVKDMDFTKSNIEDLPGGPVVMMALPKQGARVRSLVGELKSHMPWGATSPTKQYRDSQK